MCWCAPSLGRRELRHDLDRGFAAARRRRLDIAGYGRSSRTAATGCWCRTARGSSSPRAALAVARPRAPRRDGARRPRSRRGLRVPRVAEQVQGVYRRGPSRPRNTGLRWSAPRFAWERARRSMAPRGPARRPSPLTRAFRVCAVRVPRRRSPSRAGPHSALWADGVSCWACWRYGASGWTTSSARTLVHSSPGLGADRPRPLLDVNESCAPCPGTTSFAPRCLTAR